MKVSIPLQLPEKKPAELLRLVRRMRRFSRRVTVEDCAGISRGGEKTQYLHRHRNLKYSSGKPPVDYTAVELLVDFRAALSQESYYEAAQLYFQLKRLLGW